MDILENGSPPDSFSGLLRAVRERPLMILGRRSLEALWLFLHGYRYARARQGLSLNDEERQFEDFVQSVHELYGDLTTQSWAKVIERNHVNDEEAWDQFFSLLDEYRQKHDLAAVSGT